MVFLKQKNMLLSISYFIMMSFNEKVTYSKVYGYMIIIQEKGDIKEETRSL